jgi:hypothetical protein
MNWFLKRLLPQTGQLVAATTRQNQMQQMQQMQAMMGGGDMSAMMGMNPMVGV